MTDNRATVALVQRYIPHYRLNFFEKLTQVSKYGWEFLYGDHPGEGASGMETTGCAALTTRPIRNFRVGRFVWQSGATRWLKERRYQAIVIGIGLPIVSNISLLATARWLGIPVIGWSKGIAEGGRKRPAWLRFYQSVLIRQCRALIAYGQVSADCFVDLGFPVQRTFVAQNTVDTTAIVENIPAARSAAEQLRASLGLEGGMVIGYLGRLVPEKKVDRVIRAFSQAMDTGLDGHLVIAGDGPERERLESLVRNCSVSRHVHFSGRVPVGEEDVYFQMFDVFVSVRSAGLAILEAMAHGRIVLTTPEVRPETELIEHNVTGFVVKDFSTSSLAEGMLQIAANLQDSRGIGKQAQARVLSKATLEHMVKAFDSAVDFALEGRC